MDAPWDLPDGWRWERLGNLCEYVNRGRSPKYVPADGVPVINQRCVRWGGIELRHCKFTARSAARSLAEEQWLRPGDILWNSTGTGTIGRASLFSYQQGSYLADSHVTVVRPSRALPRWIEAWISTFFVQQQVGGVGSTNQVELSRDTVLDLPIPFADKAVQQQILSRVDGLFAEIDEGVQAVAEARDGVKTYRKTLLNAAVTGGLTGDWREANETIESGPALVRRITGKRSARKAIKGDQLEGAEVGDEMLSRAPLPATWCWSTIGELFSVYVGATPSRANPALWGGTVPWVSSGEVAFCRISDTREHIVRAAVSGDRIHPPGTVLLGMIGEGRTRGQAAILDVAATHNQNAASIRVSETPIPPEYVYWWLEHRYDITRALGVGGNQPALNKARVQAIPIPVPPLDEALEIVRRLENQLNELGLIPPELDEAAARAVELRQTVLAAAFRGEFTA